MESQETWKSIPNFEGFYSVSDKGRVRSEDRYIIERTTQKKYFRKGKILKPWMAKSAGNYLMVGIKKQNTSLKIAIHRLVLMAFCGYPKNNEEVRHLDGNCHNNHLENLKYGTRRENVQDAILHGTKYRRTKLKEEDILEIFKMGRSKISAKIIADKFNINRNTVTEILRGEIWKKISHSMKKISNYHKKYHLLSSEQINLILDKSKTLNEISKTLGIERHTCARWRKKFTTFSS